MATLRWEEVVAVLRFQTGETVRLARGDRFVLEAAEDGRVRLGLERGEGAEPDESLGEVPTRVTSFTITVEHAEVAFQRARADRG